MTAEKFDSPAGSLSLERVPKDPSLRAWDAADEYLLDYLSTVRKPEGQVLIVNDAFGALTCGLHQHNPTSWSDSIVAHQATAINLANNQLAIDCWVSLPTTATPSTSASPAGLVVIKIPKTLSLLEYQLRKIRPLITTETIMVAAGMTRHIHTSTLELFQSILGPTTTSLARKKARLIHTSFDPRLTLGPDPARARYDIGNKLEAVTLPGVFSRHHLDIGTRTFLEHLPTPPEGSSVLDLGCGNGAVGVTLAFLTPSAKVTFTDSSYLAVASAKETVAHCFPGRAKDHFVADNAGLGLPPNSFDLVALNPPFHDQHTVGRTVANMMFQRTSGLLRNSGELWVVANRHLRYHQLLRHHFQEVSVQGATPKFVVLVARQQRPLD